MAAPSVSYQQKRIRCGKARCRCMHTTDESRWHGPYWYAFWEENGQTKSRYMGKNYTPPARKPGARARRQAPPPPPGAKHKQRQAPPPPPPGGDRRQYQAPPPRTDPQSQDVRDAALFGVRLDVTRDELKRAWRRKIVEAHPDRYQGKERDRKEREAQEINAAYQRMCKRRGWR